MLNIWQQIQMADMNDERGLMNEMMSNSDNLEDNMEDIMDDEPNSNTDLTQTMEYSVDIREIKKHHKSREYKNNLYKFKARLRSQLERIQRKRFDSDSSSADETTLEWLERLQRNRRERPAIMPQDHSVNDNEDGRKGIDEDALQRYTNVQSTSANIENDPGMQMERLDFSESESEPTLKLLSRTDDEESGRKRESKAEKERRMVAETLGSMDRSLGGESRGRTGKQIKGSKECELKRVVKVKDQGSRTLRIYQKHEIDQTEASTRNETVEIVEKKHSHGKKKMHNTETKLPAHLPANNHQQTREVMPASGSTEESEDTDEILSHIQQLYACTPDQILARSRDHDDKAPMDVETEADNENVRGKDKDRADVKMFGKMNCGKRRFAKKAARRARLQPTSSSSENDDSKDSLDKMLRKFKLLKKEHGASSSSTDGTSSLLRRQTVRLMKRICKRPRENSETDRNGGASDIEDISFETTNLPSRKRARRSTSPDIEVEETVEAHIKKFEKGSTYTRRYFQKRHRMKHFGKHKDKAAKTDCGINSKRKINAVADEAIGPFNLNDVNAGPSTIQSDRTPAHVGLSADDGTFRLLNDTNSPNYSQQPAKIIQKGRVIRVDKMPSFFIIPKSQVKPQSAMLRKFRIISTFLIFVLMIIAMSFLIRFIFVCNPAGRCSRCDIEFALYKLIDSHSGLRHMKQPAI